MELEILEKGHYYHIYNRGIDGCTIFNNSENMDYFLRLVNKYLITKVSILSYCLMNNHFHFIVRVDDDEKKVTQAFSNLFNAYAKAFNKQNSRTGSLFEKHFRRKRIKNEEYLTNLIIYIHTNPMHHGISQDFTNYPYSSYSYYVDGTMPNNFSLSKEEAINLFNSIENLMYVHQKKLVELMINTYKVLETLQEEQRIFRKNSQISLTIT
ncbi:hypothetical protein UMM65_08095 [Aureibaculum sp. 2210JD6-5]|uniref:hypothetical protein n=1 Tax=Aureibaculum sp. 2210JD6-5 TaxID=3103957 RepID=UPI002AAEF1AC|nr:hypothetical protein [Aureibaculum sp. 2210JD6-5]MDY7395200.1 hypothetical protein [Aureibaculum sp. 2210JD6-5]